MNLCILTGNLGNDPEFFYSSNGDPIATFNLAFKSGKDKTSWVKVTTFSSTAEVCEKYLHKGARIIVNGSLHQDKWESDDGEKRSAMKVIANRIEFIKTDGRGLESKQDDGDVPF